MAGDSIKRLLVVGVLVTAGCSGFGFSGGEESVRTVTPVPVPTSESAAYPVGLSQDGVTSPSLLGAAHARQLNDTGYTLTMNRTVRYPNGSLHSHLRVHVALDRNRTHLANVSVRGHAAPVLLGRPPASASFWSDGDTYLRRLVRDNQTIYNRYEPPDSYAGTWRYWVHTAALNGRPGTDVAGTVSPFRTTTMGTRTTTEPVYVVRGDQLKESESRPEWESRRNVTLIAHVSESGLVRYYRTEYTTTTPSGERVHVTRTVRFDDVGETSVGRPAWHDRALDTDE